MSDTNQKSEADEKRYLARKPTPEDLQMYLKKMAYKMPEKPPKIPKRIDELAVPKPRLVEVVAEEYGHVFSPRQRAKRMKGKLKEQRPMTSEQVEMMLRAEQQNEERALKAKKRRLKAIQDDLVRMQNDAHHQLMEDLKEKFANYVAMKCIHNKNEIFKIIKERLNESGDGSSSCNEPQGAPLAFVTQCKERLIRFIKQAVFMSLAPQTCNWTFESEILNVIADVLADMVLDMMFRAQRLATMPCQPPPKDTDGDRTEKRTSSDEDSDECEPDVRRGRWTKTRKSFLPGCQDTKSPRN